MSLPDLESFANRLRKVYRHNGKWARRQGITCYRIYDADMPEFPIVIDRYEDCIHAAEYSRPHGLDESEHRIWRSGCRQAMQDVLEVPAERIFFKERQPQKGTQQYERLGDKKKEIIAREGGLQFWVNLSDYLDAGLFLDHRITRQMVREQSAGKRVLNLFAYTGSFTVYAAAGGALSTTTVDLSNTYLDWAKRNMELNGFGGQGHQFVRADIKSWFQNPARERYDLAVLDPPTFSNSKAMRDVLDIQRDHAELINQTLKLMSPGGIIFFSTNYRRFHLDEAAIETAHCKNISAQTVPPDFRNKKIHQCYLLSRG